MKKIMRIRVEGPEPSYANEEAAGLDLRLYADQPLVFQTGDHKTVHTGVYAEIPAGYFGLVAIRSGLGSRGLVLSNAIGIIDPDYRGEIRLPLYYHGEGSLQLEPGERVAQMVLIPYLQPELEEVDQLSATDRGEKGFGSSGRF